MATQQSIKINQEFFRPKRYKLYNVDICCLFRPERRHYNIRVLASGINQMKERAIAYGYTLNNPRVKICAFGVGKPDDVRVEGWKIEQYII